MIMRTKMRERESRCLDVDTNDWETDEWEELFSSGRRTDEGLRYEWERGSRLGGEGTVWERWT
jgi:hypothetical protein